MRAFFAKFRAFFWAAVLHVAIGAALVIGFEQSNPIFKSAPKNESVEIIKGAAVDERAIAEQVEKLKQQDEAKRQAERDRQKQLDEAKKKAQEEKRKAEEAKKKAEAEAKKLAEQKAEEEKRLAEIAAKRKAEEEAKRKAEEAKKKAEAEAKKLAEQKAAEEKRLAEIEAKRKAEEARKKAEAEAKRKAAEEAARKQRQAEEQRLLDQLLESEGRDLGAENQSQLDILLQVYQNDIQQKVESSWLRPSNFQSGWECVVDVRQGPGGTVLSAVARDCNGDEQFRNSVENAVYRAEPLPAPEDPSLFARELVLEFKPEN